MVSERALPFEKLIELVNNSPTLIPILYMVNKSGGFWGASGGCIIGMEQMEITIYLEYILTLWRFHIICTLQA